MSNFRSVIPSWNIFFTNYLFDMVDIFTIYLFNMVDIFTIYLFNLVVFNILLTYQNLEMFDYSKLLEVSFFLDTVVSPTAFINGSRDVRSLEIYFDGWLVLLITLGNYILRGTKCC